MLKKILLVTLVLSMLVTGCAKTEKEAPKTKTPEFKPVKLGVLPIEDNLPLYLAEAEKMFIQEGLKVELVPFDSARERDTAMQAGQIDGEVADLVAVALLKKGGTDVRAAAIGLGAKPEEGRFALLAAPKSKAKTVADLKNTPIAISENSIIEYVTDKLLAAGGVSKKQIKKVAIPSIPARMEALLSSQVQAAVLPDPLATLAQTQGAKLLTDDTKNNLSQTVILFRKEAIDNNKAALIKVVQVYGKAALELTNNPDKYRSLFIEKARVPAPLKNTYKSPKFSALQAPSEEDVAKVIDWMVVKKLLPQIYPYEELVDTSLLQK